MRITWYGHAAFLIETSGLRIILDPYRSPDCGGYAPIDERADIVVVSHENDRYHSHRGQIVPPFAEVRGLEVPAEGVEVRGIRFYALRVYESPQKLPGDEVTIVHFRSEGRHIVFLGDLGHTLEAHELEPLRGADVVLCPAGGSPTIALDEIAPLLVALQPRIVVPMHYFIAGKINLPIAPLERFLEALTPLGWRTVAENASSFLMDDDSTAEGPTIVCLNPAR
jgi:L-ascorbate metabolism protein UlaG (beta-lactamase superfamily)